MAIAEILNCQKFDTRSVQDIAVNGNFAVEIDVEGGLSGVEFFHYVDDPQGTNRFLTSSAMNGNGNGNGNYIQTTQDRLLIGDPTQLDIDRVAPAYIRKLDPEATPAIRILQAARIPVIGHSGGFARVMGPLKEKLGIPIYSNQIHLNKKTGKYTVLEDQSVLLLDDGKRQLAQQLVEEGAVPINFSAGGDSPKDVKMGGSPSFAVTTFVNREEAVTKSDFSFSGMLGAVPVWLGEKRYKNVRDGTMAKLIRIGMERIIRGKVVFQNQELGDEIRDRVLFHSDPYRDFDVRHILPRNGVIFNGNGKSY